MLSNRGKVVSKYHEGAIVKGLQKKMNWSTMVPTHMTKVGGLIGSTYYAKLVILDISSTNMNVA